MKSDIIVIGGGASGLMASYGAAKTFVQGGSPMQVTLLEKMPRSGRKIMITGKGRCNFTNLKDWNEFSSHIRSRKDFLKSAFYNFPPSKVIDFFEEYGMKTVVERGDRAFPASYHASEVVDTLMDACRSLGVKIETDFEVSAVEKGPDDAYRFAVVASDGRKYLCRSLVIATGGLSYPSTGSSGDGYLWAKEFGHSLTPLFPSLTAIVPRGYKILDGYVPDMKFHIDRSLPLSDLGQSLCGQELKNVGLSLVVEGVEAENEFGDVQFTDGGLEGPLGFQVSRKCVKSLVNGSRAEAVIDLKPGVDLTELTARVKELWTVIQKDPRSERLREKERCRILLGKLLPWDLIPAFMLSNPGILTLERKSRTQTKVWVNLPTIAKSLKAWSFPIEGYVGYERAVVTAGGVENASLFPKTMESRLCAGLYFCGEILDVDCDTGGYNLQAAFCTGRLAGESAAKALVNLSQI